MKTRGLLLTGMLLAGCAPQDPAPLIASDIVVTAPRPGTAVSAGYMTLSNASDGVIVVTSVTSPQFGRVEMHETVIEDDIARMRALDEIVIAAGESVRFERGGKHLMLMQPGADMDVVRLYFHSGDELILSVSTRGMSN